jgi:hypothetical protein
VRQALVRAGLLAPVASLAGRDEGRGVPGTAFTGVPGEEVNLAEAVEGCGFSSSVTDLAKQRQRLLVATASLPVFSLQPADIAETVQTYGLAPAIAGFAERGYGPVLVNGRLLVQA